MEKIKIKYFTDIEPIAVNPKGDWVDLRAAEDTTLMANESTLIPLGVAMKLPEGYEAIIAPRSSTYKKFGIVQSNGIGVVDSSFSGDGDMWRMPVRAVRETVIHKNDRICQFRIQKVQPKIEFETVADLGGKNRGGFGSTGTN